MTAMEWDAGTEYLMNGEEGDWVEHEGRKVEIVSMCGGRYILFNESGEFCDLTDEVWRAMEFLKSGKVFCR